MNAWLILDSNYLCWRAHHSTGGLSHEGEGTGVAYGYLRALLTLKDQFGPGVRFLHCFDHGPYVRLRLYPDYKAKRRPKAAAEESTTAGVCAQIDALRDELLPALGFRNVFHEIGYEADDMAALARAAVPGKAAVVSADKDLYQLIGPNTIVFDPRKGESMNVARFSTTYGVGPEQWPLVRALAGCATDNVKGVRGVGEKTACRCAAGLLPDGSNAARLIAKHFNAATGVVDRLVELNLRLVSLPLVGCAPVAVRDDKLSAGKWRRACRSLGIKSLAERFIGS